MEQRWNLEDLHKNYDEVYANLDETLKEAQQFAINQEQNRQETANIKNSFLHLNPNQY